MEIGTQLELTITGISHQGYGIGRVDNIVVFIPGAMLGETVLAEVTDYKKKMITAKLVEVLTPWKTAKHLSKKWVTRLWSSPITEWVPAALTG